MAAIIPIHDWSATPIEQELSAVLDKPLRALAEEVAAFRREPPTPERTYAFEKKRQRLFARRAVCC